MFLKRQILVAFLENTNFTSQEYSSNPDFEAVFYLGQENFWVSNPKFQTLKLPFSLFDLISESLQLLEDIIIELSLSLTSSGPRPAGQYTLHSWCDPTY